MYLLLIKKTKNSLNLQMTLTKFRIKSGSQCQWLTFPARLVVNCLRCTDPTSREPMIRGRLARKREGSRGIDIPRQPRSPYLVTFGGLFGDRFRNAPRGSNPALHRNRT